MTREVTTNFKTTAGCPCGCGATGRVLKATGHAKNCDVSCRRCAHPGRQSSKSLPAAVRRQVASRSGGRCEAAPLVTVEGCGGVGEHAHHVRLRSQQGADTVSNLRWVCHSHHTWIHDHPADAAALGLLERTTA